MFKIIRITLLLLILLGVAAGAWRSQRTSVQWKYTLPVNVYPINADASAASAAYIRSLKREDFLPIETFMQEEAARYNRSAKASIEIRLGKPVDEVPPTAPIERSALNVILWSLQMRWWAYRHGETRGSGTQVKLFLLYFDPARNSQLAHSTALQKGLIGRVNVFASPAMAKQNNVVIAHEFLHTLGATDKYELGTNQPQFPEGYAEPDLSPRLPQRFAEIMGGRTPLTALDSETPDSLGKALIGPKTAQEINWQADQK
jgi:hypothetical protein